MSTSPEDRKATRAVVNVPRRQGHERVHGRADRQDGGQGHHHTTTRPEALPLRSGGRPVHQGLGERGQGGADDETAPSRELRDAPCAKRARQGGGSGEAMWSAASWASDPDERGAGLGCRLTIRPTPRPDEGSASRRTTMDGWSRKAAYVESATTVEGGGAQEEDHRRLRGDALLQEPLRHRHVAALADRKSAPSRPWPTGGRSITREPATRRLHASPEPGWDTRTPSRRKARPRSRPEEDRHRVLGPRSHGRALGGGCAAFRTASRDQLAWPALESA